jgi:hypothetical protein
MDTGLLGALVMSRQRRLLLLRAVGALLFLSPQAAGADNSRSYSLTVFVDQGGRAAFDSGHVFVEISDGGRQTYAGFYPQEARTATFGKATGPLHLAGGEIRDDRHHRWDVRRDYSITSAGYLAALRAIEATRSHHGSWCLTNHCGDFALAVAKAAGVSLDLPTHRVWTDRPAAFGGFLLQHGGTTRDDAIATCKSAVAVTVSRGEVALANCKACSEPQKAAHIATLHGLRDQDLESCSRIGVGD